MKATREQATVMLEWANRQEALHVMHETLIEAVKARRTALDVLLSNDVDKHEAVIMGLALMLGHYLAASTDDQKHFNRRVRELTKWLWNDYADFKAAAKHWPEVS